jgi:hypothetical protein
VRRVLLLLVEASMVVEVVEVGTAAAARRARGPHLTTP